MTSSQDKMKGKHLQLYEELFAGIMSGSYSPGEKIPNEVDLAALHGVSRPTVAKAIKLLEQKGLLYRRPGAGTFVRKPDAVTQQKIGLLMPRLSLAPQEYGHFVSLGSMIVSEISRRANADSHILLLNDLPYGNENQVIVQAEQICQQLIDLQVKGVFFMPFELSPENQDVNVRIAERFRDAGIAVTLIDRDIYNDRRRSAFDIVCIDDEQAAYEVTEHLIKLGCKKIEFVAARVDVTSISRRVQGFREALENNGLDFRKDSVHRLPFLPFMKQDKSKEHQAVDKFLKDLKADALVCVNDRLASIVMGHAAKAGKNIPEDLRIVSFDDEPFGAYLPVPLTTMRQPATALGAEAMRMLISRSQELDMPPREVMIKAELVIRQSCGSVQKSAETIIQGVNGQEAV
jgi:LacI family transcriptional regulator